LWNIMQDHHKTLHINSPTNVLASKPQDQKKPTQQRETHCNSRITENGLKESNEQSSPKDGLLVKELEDPVKPEHLDEYQWLPMCTPMNTPTAKPVAVFNANIPQFDLNVPFHRQSNAVHNARHIKALMFPYSRASLRPRYEQVGSTEQGELGEPDAELLAMVEGLAWASPQVGFSLLVALGVDPGLARDLAR
jgi:hypothetical protein